MPPPRLQRLASWIYSLLCFVASARGLDVEIYDEISEESYLVSVQVRSLQTGLIFAHVFFGTCYPTHMLGLYSSAYMYSRCYNGAKAEAARSYEWYAYTVNVAAGPP